MNSLIIKIKDTYLERCKSYPLQKDIWEDLASFFKPDIKIYRLNRPSTVLTGETGDLGLAVLWVVQTALIRPIINDLVLAAPRGSTFISLASNIDNLSLCALAHSEDHNSPVILTEVEEHFQLNGVKKFITAGINADYILTTCRDKDEAKINRVVMLNSELINPEEMKDLNLPIMKSVSHTSFNFNNKAIPAENVPQIDDRKLRRSLKKWGIIERALIIEAYIPFLHYFNKAANAMGIKIVEDEVLLNLISEQSSLAGKQIDEAFYEEKIITKNIETEKLFKIISLFRENQDKILSSIDEADKIKFRDIFLFDSLK
ncbi:MAG: hypothetical protein WDA74_10545 [Spirochaetota bacterium]